RQMCIRDRWSIVRYEFPARGDLPPVKVTWYDGGTRMPAKTKEMITGFVNAAMGSSTGGPGFAEAAPDMQAASGTRAPSDHRSPTSTKEVGHPMKDAPLVPPNGALLIGDKGTLFVPDEYGWTYRLLRGDPPVSPLGKGGSGDPPASPLGKGGSGAPPASPLGKGGSGFEDYEPPAPTLPRVTGEHHAEWIRACKGEGKTLSNFDYAGPLSEMVLLGSLAIRVRQRIEWDAANMKVTNVSKANDYLRRDYRKGWTL
ncbi:MAG: hypothetical protein QUV05_18765, partial [Phycisphaerae bacterium]|nr:hypothetical protein [Phycisphaerae bacterium]